jgi:hypothetical protein
MIGGKQQRGNNGNLPSKQQPSEQKYGRDSGDAGDRREHAQTG